MFKKRAGVFYRVLHPFFEQLQKHSTESTCLGSPNKDSNCEGKILAYNKNKLCLISNHYIENTNEECFIRI